MTQFGANPRNTGSFGSSRGSQAMINGEDVQTASGTARPFMAEIEQRGGIAAA